MAVASNNLPAKSRRLRNNKQGVSARTAVDYPTIERAKVQCRVGALSRPTGQDPRVSIVALVALRSTALPQISTYQEDQPRVGPNQRKPRDRSTANGATIAIIGRGLFKSTSER